MKNNIEIDTFTLSDLESVSDSLEKDFDNFWNYNILKNELNNPSSFYLCCKQYSEVVGFAGVSIVLDTAELNNIVIKKSERGKGLSFLLLDSLIKFVKQHNCKQINLEVASSNTVAISLYKKFGFKQVGLRKGYYNGVDALLFTLVCQ